MCQPIDAIISEMLNQLKAYGVSVSTLEQKEVRYCRPILTFFKERHCPFYSRSLLDEYINQYREKLACGNISSKYFKAIEKNVQCIVSIAETGSADFSRSCFYKKYLPNPEYLSHIENALSSEEYKPDYYYKHECCLRKFLVYIDKEDIPLENVTDAVFLDYLIKIASVDNSGSLDYVIRSLTLFVDYLNQHLSLGLTIDLSRFRPKPLAKRIIEPYTIDEIKSLLNQIDKSTPVGRRDYAIIMLAYHTGLRACDIRNLKLNDINWHNHSLSITQSKTGMPVTIPLTVSCMNPLADYILNDRPKTPVDEIFLTSIRPYRKFTRSSTLDRIIDNLAFKAGIEKKPFRSFHSLRRSFASGMSYNQVPLTTISQLLGHSSFASDRRYLSYNDRLLVECAAGLNEIPITAGCYSLPSHRNLESIISADFRGIEVKGGVFA